MITVPTKLCRGPAHAQPVYLPETDEYWYFHNTGERRGCPTARCRLCINWGKLLHKDGPHGLVPANKIRPLVNELVDRCGSTKAVQRIHGINATTLQAILREGHKGVQKRTVRNVILALAEQRKNDRLNGTSTRFQEARKFQAQREEKIIRMAGY